MNVVFSHRADDDLRRIRTWIARDSPRSAAQVVDQILSCTADLRVFPRMGKKTDFPATRELVVPRLPFIVVYKIDEARDEVFVIAIYHAAQDRSDWRG